jgi:hypothetical protein
MAVSVKECLLNGKGKYSWPACILVHIRYFWYW